MRCLALCLLLATASPSAEVAPASAGPPVIAPGEVTEFTAPLSEQLRRVAGGGPLSRFEVALAAVAVPKDFTPDRTWPVLIVSSTSDLGYNSSRALLRQFAAPALRAGWIVVAADPPAEVAVKDDTNALRYALVAAALARLHGPWPRLARWPRAFGGFSGGAKRSAWLAALSAREGYQPLGVFQAGCNQPVMIDALDGYRPGRDRFLATPVFLSSGTDDRIATPGAMRDVAADLRAAGFGHVRLESFSGRHQVNPDHLEQALRWFIAVAAGAAR